MNEPRLRVRETGTAVEITLHVQPRAKRSEFAGLHDGALKIRVCAPPVDDKANRAVIEFFSSLLGVPKSRLQIVSGLKSREKVLRIEAFSLKDLSQYLPAEPA